MCCFHCMRACFIVRFRFLNVVIKRAKIQPNEMRPHNHLICTKFRGKCYAGQRVQHNIGSNHIIYNNSSEYNERMKTIHATLTHDQVNVRISVQRSFALTQRFRTLLPFFCLREKKTDYSSHHFDVDDVAVDCGVSCSTLKSPRSLY